VTTFRSKDGKITGKGAKHKSLNWPEAINGAHRLDSNLDKALEAGSAEEDGKARTVGEAHKQAQEKRMAERKAAKKQKQRFFDGTKIEEILSGVDRDEGESLKDFKKRLMMLVRKDAKIFLPGVNTDDKGTEQELSHLVGKFLGAKVATSKKSEA